MPGLICTRKEFISKDVLLKDLFGYFYCEIEVDYNYLGLLHTYGLKHISF